MGDGWLFAAIRLAGPRRFLSETVHAIDVASSVHPGSFSSAWVGALLDQRQCRNSFGTGYVETLWCGSTRKMLQSTFSDAVGSYALR